MNEEENIEGLSEMPIWKDHEKRITTLEVNMSGLSEKIDRVDETIKEGNREQKETLDKINERMYDEFLDMKKDENKSRLKKEEISTKYKWKFVSKVIAVIAGSGGIIYFIVEKIMEVQ